MQDLPHVGESDSAHWLQIDAWPADAYDSRAEGVILCD
jgi:hypothetical protein